MLEEEVVVMVVVDSGCGSAKKRTRSRQGRAAASPSQVIRTV